MKTIALFLLAASFQCCFGQTDSSVLAVGDWSPVVNDCQHALRGRLVICDDNGPSAANHARVYLELRHVFHGAWEAPLKIFYKIGMNDGDLRFEMRDQAGHPIPQTPIAIRGPMPSPCWITLPCDATMRLRADEYLLGPANKPDGLEILAGGCWIIPNNTTNSYMLSATFATPKEELSRTNRDDWQGTLTLPKVKIPPKGPKPEPVAEAAP